MNGCGTLQVSTQLSVQLGDVPVALSNSFTASPSAGLLADNVVQVAPGVSAVPIGPLTIAQLGYLYLENLDNGTALALSLNADGSAPFARIKPGQHAMIPVEPNTAFYFVVAGNPVQALVLALST